MIDAGSLPPQVLVKIATLEQACIGLGEKLEASRRDLQRLRIERRDCVPQTVYDQAGVNEESERVLSEWARLDAAIEAQIAQGERLERRLRGEEAIVRECKQFLHELPANARLRVVESMGGDLDSIRQRIEAVKGEISQTQNIPVLSGDLGARIVDYVADIAAKARPLISGTGDGESLRVLFPLHDHADRTTQSGFSPREGNPLLLAALMQPEKLANVVLQSAVAVGIQSNEKATRLQALQAEMVTLRYAEEAAICAANGQDAVRSSSAPPWSILMVAVENEQAAAAA